MVNIPDPERQLDPDHVFYEGPGSKEGPDVYRTGRQVLNHIRHFGFKFHDKEHGITREVVDIRPVDDGAEDELTGSLTDYDGEEAIGEPRRVRFTRHVRESMPITFIEEHPKTTAIAASVAVGSLVIARSVVHKRKKD